MLRRLVVVVIAAACALMLAGCSSPNYDGTGNEFVITGTVIESSSDAVTLVPITVKSASGIAATWFNGDDGGWFGTDHRVVHNNYYDGRDFWSSQKYVGAAYDSQGNQIALESIAAGTVVEATGHIRTSRSGKTTKDRPVFDTLKVKAQ